MFDEPSSALPRPPSRVKKKTPPRYRALEERPFSAKSGGETGKAVTKGPFHVSSCSSSTYALFASMFAIMVSLQLWRASSMPLALTRMIMLPDNKTVRGMGRRMAMEKNEGFVRGGTKPLPSRWRQRPQRRKESSKSKRVASSCARS